MSIYNIWPGKASESKEACTKEKRLNKLIAKTCLRLSRLQKEKRAAKLQRTWRLVFKTFEAVFLAGP